MTDNTGIDDRALMEASLEVVANSGIDIVAEFFDRFFAAYPEQRDSFQRPQATQGAMVTEMLDYLLAQGAQEGWVDGSFAECTQRHDSYSNIAPVDFANTLRILVQTLAFAAGAEWRPQFSDVWGRQIEGLMLICDQTPQPIGPRIGPC